ncbi:MAG: sulfatase [Candidatus Binatia bacterium]|nr:sulfatase [Candidatus Binatia bacterium]
MCTRDGRSVALAYRWSLALASLGLLITTACSRGPVGPEGVTQRLRAEDFGQPVAEHAPMLAIGRTAREVIAVPERRQIAEVQGALFEDGIAQMQVELEPVPQGATVELEVMAIGLPVLMEPVVRDGVAEHGRYVRLERGWDLERADAGPARLTVEAGAVRLAVPEEQATKQVVARLFARSPIPAFLSSQPFQPPQPGAIEIPYGVLGAGEAMSVGGVQMSAILRCGDRVERLLQAKVAPGNEAPGWHVHTVELPRLEGPCKLELEQADSDGTPSAYVVWGTPQIVAETDERDLRIVMISLDTLRADHMSGYGYPRDTTPEIDRRLIQRGVRFEDAMTTIASTGIAHLSLFTGLYPRDQRKSGRLAARDASVTLAERLQSAEYATAAFTEDGLLAGPFGFWYGFDLFREYHVVSDARGINVFDDGIEYVRANRDRRFFLFLHTYKVHDPFEFDEATRTRFSSGADWVDGTLDPRVPKAQRSVVDAYDRTIVEADRIVAGFLDELDRLDLAGRTLVVLLSDHGEAFGEHQVRGHGLGVGQEQLRIPLVFRGPGVAEGHVRRVPVSIADVASTILDIAGLAHDGLGGSRSLASLIVERSEAEPEAEPPRERPLFFTRLLSDADGARLGSTKLLKTKDSCTQWNLETDPLENRPMLVECDAVGLAGEIVAYRDAATSRHARDREGLEESFSIPPDTEDSLRALGYVE